MEKAHGTTKLITDYGALDQVIALKNDPASIRNEDDYDDWDYGTEPIPGDPTWIKKPNS
jgi:hypothetical protein